MADAFHSDGVPPAVETSSAKIADTTRKITRNELSSSTRVSEVKTTQTADKPIADSLVPTNAGASVTEAPATDSDSTGTHDKPQETELSTAWWPNGWSNEWPNGWPNENPDQPTIITQDADPPAAGDVGTKYSINAELLEASGSGNTERILQLLSQGADELARNQYGETPLHVAVRLDQFKAVEVLLGSEKVRNNINLKDDKGWTALHSCADSEYSDIAFMILNTGTADIYVRDNSGRTALDRACCYGTARVVELLLAKEKENGISTIELACPDGWTPLYKAYYRGDMAIVRVLLGHNANARRRLAYGETLLHRASTDGEAEIVSVLVTQERTLLDLIDDSSKTALHSAAEGRHATVVRVLVEAGANVDLYDSEGYTPLMSFCRSIEWDLANESDEETVKLLARNTKDINHVDHEGYTALNFTFRFHHFKLTKTLLEHKADPNINNYTGECTILGTASAYGDVEMVKLLLKYGAAIEAFDKYNWTALHHACGGVQPEAVEVLLEAGADRSKRTRDTGEMPLHIAVMSGSEAIIKLLLKPVPNSNLTKIGGTSHIEEDKVSHHWVNLESHNSGFYALVDTESNINASTATGETALHIAVRRGDYRIVQILLDAGSDINAVTSGDETPLRLAGKGGHGVQAEEEDYERTVKLLSSRLEPQRRKQALLDFYGDEEETALRRLVKSLDWTDLEKTEVEGQGYLIRKAARREDHGILRQILRERCSKMIQEEQLPPNFKEETATALQWAAYFGDHLIVWWILYSGWSTEMRIDRQEALNIAKWCRDKLTSSEETSNGTTKKEPAPSTSRKRQLSRDESKMKPTSADPSAIQQATRVMPEDVPRVVRSDSNREVEQRCTTLHSIHLVQSAGMKEERENERTSRSAREKHSDSGTRKRDYLEVIDTLQDPPFDCALVRGLSKKDHLYPKNLKPTANDDILKVKELAGKFDITIIDCYRKNANSGADEHGEVDFLRRTRSVWDVVYETQAGQKKSKMTQKEIKMEKRDREFGTTNMIIDGEKICGPGDIMKHARSKIHTAGTGSQIVKKNAYTEDDLQFRWLHLPANNVS
jgi:ankyrin repeat protein